MDWSRLGKMQGYAGQHARLLYIFCAEVMALKPDIVITECVEDEDVSMLRVIIGDIYDIESVVLNSDDFGDKVNRKRRVSAWINRQK